MVTDTQLLTHDVVSLIFIKWFMHLNSSSVPCYSVVLLPAQHAVLLGESQNTRSGAAHQPMSAEEGNVHAYTHNIPHSLLNSRHTLQ